jgi:hypothetical protein|nr:MAG TPA: hypothetical protein [Caudoviricetes sp.]
MKNVNVQVNLFNQGIRDWERIIDDNIDGIDFDDLTMNQYVLIVNSMRLVCDIINNVIKQQEK